MLRIKEAVILAGGLGTRLKSLVRDLPKPMADVSGRPFLSYLIEFLSSQGVRRAVISAGYKNGTITEYFGKAHKGVKLEYVIEEKPLGTGGALREAVKASEGKDVFAMNGDSFFALDLSKMEFFHLTGRPLVTMAIKPVADAARFGRVRVEDTRVAGFEEKAGSGPGFINGGVYILNRKILDPLNGFKESFSFENGFLRLNTGSILPFVSDSYFIDIGIPEDYLKARVELAGRVEKILMRPNGTPGRLKIIPAF